MLYAALQGVCHVCDAEEGFTRPEKYYLNRFSHDCTAVRSRLQPELTYRCRIFLGNRKIVVKVPETMKLC